MVGWSRRNSESRERRERFRGWWSTLTEAEKKAYNDAEAIRHAGEMRMFRIFFTCWLVTAAVGGVAVLAGACR